MRDLNNHKIFIGGIQGSGKTHLAKFLIKRKFRKAIMLRLTPDFDDVDNLTLILPGPNKHQTLEDIARYLVTHGKLYEAKKIPQMPYDVFVIDEADMFFKNAYDMGPMMDELVLMHRHYGLAMIFITRRPQDIPARVQESCKYHFYFKIEGKNVYDRLRSVDSSLPDYVDKLEFEKHNFVFKELGRPPVIHKAVR